MPGPQQAVGKQHGPELERKLLARGALYLMLQNRIYRSQIVHKGQHYSGEHEAIIDGPPWNEVQAKLSANAIERVSSEAMANPSLPAGLLYNGRGYRMTPSHAVKKGRCYRYYVSQPLIKKSRDAAPEELRIAAGEIKRIVLSGIGQLLDDPRRPAEALPLRPVSSSGSSLGGASLQRPGCNCRPGKYARRSQYWPAVSTVWIERVDFRDLPERAIPAPHK